MPELQGKRTGSGDFSVDSHCSLMRVRGAGQIAQNPRFYAMHSSIAPAPTMSGLYLRRGRRGVQCGCRIKCDFKMACWCGVSLAMMSGGTLAKIFVLGRGSSRRLIQWTMYQMDHAPASGAANARRQSTLNTAVAMVSMATVK